MTEFGSACGSKKIILADRMFDLAKVAARRAKTDPQ
jgi:hypothetical protein